MGNKQLGFENGAAYEFLGSPRYTWQRFFHQLVIKIVKDCEVIPSEGEKLTAALAKLWVAGEVAEKFIAKDT